MRVIVTGGSGFVGTNLVDHLTTLGHTVLNLDRAAPRNPVQRPCWRQVDLLDRSALIDAVRDFAPTALVHLAARTDLAETSDLAGYAANIDGVCHLLEAVHATPTLQRLVVASSQLVCDIGYRPEDDHDLRPSTLYGHSKVLTEKIVRSAGDLGVSWTLVRPTSLWGPWFAEPYRNFFEVLQKGLYLHPKGLTIEKQWGFVGNVVHQLERLLAAPDADIHGRTFYLADYRPTELGRFARKVQRALGAPPVRAVPPGLLRSAARSGDALKALGWKHPPLTSFRYHNLITPELQDLDPLERVVGPLPYSEDEAIAITVSWLGAQGERDVPPSPLATRSTRGSNGGRHRRRRPR